jgi:DNA polymerase-3 subunit gamma/tau
LKHGKVAHAYLFTGSRGVGKTTTARLLAKTVNCEQWHSEVLTKDPSMLLSFEPCNVCAACREITAGSFLDVYEMDAASNTGVDHVRENIIEHVRFTPVHGRYKVYIIDEVHMLSPSAFNALLKTLEEPPAHVLFILATTEIHKVPATIISRCQRFDFRRLTADETVARLQILCAEEQVKVAEEVLRQIARQTEGCERDAESMLGQLLALGEQEIGFDEASLVLPITPTQISLDFWMHSYVEMFQARLVS